MKKNYLLVLSILYCTQSIHSMEKEETTIINILQQPNNRHHEKMKLMKFTQKTISDLYYKPFLSQEQDIPRFINILVSRWDAIHDIQYSLPQRIDTLSEKLYNHNLTENEINDLVKQGANVNYHHPRHTRYTPDTIPLPLYFAMNNSEQGVKNMQTIINHKAELHDIPGEIDTPLAVALDLDYLPMIELLLPYEKPATEIFTEKKGIQRKALIEKIFAQKKFELIESLLTLKLMTPNQGLNILINSEKQNPAIMKYLIENGASNHDAWSTEITDDIFTLLDKKIQLLYHLTSNGAFSEQSLNKVSFLKEMLTKTEDALKKNSPS